MNTQVDGGTDDSDELLRCGSCYPFPDFVVQSGKPWGVSGNVALGVTLQSDLEGILNLKAFSCRYTSTLTNPSKPD